MAAIGKIKWVCKKPLYIFTAHQDSGGRRRHGRVVYKRDCSYYHLASSDPFCYDNWYANLSKGEARFEYYSILWVLTMLMQALWVSGQRKFR